MFETEHGRFAKQLYYPNIHYENMAQAAISTILAALQEPTEKMKDAWWNDSGAGFEEDWKVMFNASPLGEQSE